MIAAIVDITVICIVVVALALISTAPIIVWRRRVAVAIMEEEFVPRQNAYKTSNKFPACTPATNLGVKR